MAPRSTSTAPTRSDLRGGPVRCGAAAGATGDRCQRGAKDLLPCDAPEQLLPEPRAPMITAPASDSDVVAPKQPQHAALTEPVLLSCGLRRVSSLVAGDDGLDCH